MSVSAEVPAEPLEIIDTVEIEPNVITLLKDEVRYTANFETDCVDNCVQVTQEEAECLLKIAWSEAGCESIEGQKKVMEVVWNRKNNPNYPDTVYEVISQTGQFESFTNGRYNIAQPTWETRMALAEFEKNLSMDNEIVAFETVCNGNSLLRYFDFVYAEGKHTFYKEKNKH